MGNNTMDEMMQSVVMSEELKEKIKNQTINGQKVVTFKKRSYKKVIMVAALCAAMIGTFSVSAATNAEKIEKYLAELFGIDEKTQEALLSDGYVQDLVANAQEGDVVSVTQNGVTITAKQTVVDDTSMVILLNVKSENGVELGSSCDFSKINIDKSINEKAYSQAVEKDHEIHYNHGKGKAAEGSLYEQWFVINFRVAGADIIGDGDQISMTLKNILNCDTNVSKPIIAGEWKLNWTIRVNEDKLEIPINQVISGDEEKYIIDRIEVTPLAFKVKFSMEEWVQDNIVYQHIYVPHEDRDVNLAGKPCAKLDYQFVMKDGRVYEYSIGRNGVTLIDRDEKTIVDMWYFDELIDIDQLSSVIIQGVEFPVVTE